MNETKNDSSPVQQDRVESGSKSPTKYGSDDVLYIVAWATLGQAMCFLVVSMILDDVTVLPTDPLTIIGTTYVVMGTAFMCISCFLHKMKNSEPSASKDKKFTTKLDIGEFCSQDESSSVDAPCECGFGAPSEHPIDDELDIRSGASDVIPGLHDDTDCQWQILDSGTRARNITANSEITTTSNESDNKKLV